VGQKFDFYQPKQIYWDKKTGVKQLHQQPNSFRNGQKKKHINADVLLLSW
jgi:hypothetical protein